MPTKYSNVLGRLYYRDEYGHWHEVFAPIPTIECRNSGDDKSFKGYFSASNLEFSLISLKNNKAARKILKQHRQWVNRLNRYIRRQKRIKEQERRAMLKWRALHHDGE